MGIFVYMKGNSQSVIVRSTSFWLVIASIVFVSVFSLRKGWLNVITWDVVGYYHYLPALFIDHDIRLENLAHQEALRQKYDFSSSLYQFHEVEGTSAHVDQYSYGMALAYSPAFFVGHWCAGWFGYEQDGFSWPYQCSLWLWTLLWIALGFFQLRKLLLHFFSEAITSWLIIALIFGSNYLFNVAGAMATSHGYLFTYFVLFLNAVIRWQHQQTIRSLISVCLIAGLAAICRPTEILWMIIPLLWGVDSVKSLLIRVKYFLWNKKGELIVAAVVFIALAFPQFLYWKTVTGHWIYNSYSNPGEGFDFLSPHTYSFLFSARKGWFIYTPMAAIGAFGLWKLKNYAPYLWWSFGVYFLVNLYLVSSWTTWWYAQCFSQRAMVQTLPMILIGLGFLWKNIEFTKWRGKLSLVVSILSVVIGLWFNLLYHRYVLHMDRMTPQYLSKVFYRWNKTSEFNHLLLVNHNSDSLPNFENEAEYKRGAPVVLGTDTALLHPQSPFLGMIENAYSEFGSADHYGIEIAAEIWMDSLPEEGDILLVGQMAHHEKPYGYRTTGFKPAVFVPGQWNPLSVYYLTPEMRSREDVFKCFVWYRGQKEIKVRSRSVTLYEPIFQP